MDATKLCRKSFHITCDDPRELPKIYLITPLRIRVTLELTEHRKPTSYGSRPVCKHGPGSFLCHLKKPQPPVGTSRCQRPRGIGERLDPPEIKRRPGLAIRSECRSADDSCRHDAAKIVRCKRCIEMETLPCPSFETDTRCPHVGDFWVCCSQRS